TLRSLQVANADVTGVLRLTSRWESLSQEEVAQLGALLERPLVRGPETREAALEALAEELLVAAAPSPVDDVTDSEEVPPDGLPQPADATAADGSSGVTTSSTAPGAAQLDGGEGEPGGSDPGSDTGADPG